MDHDELVDISKRSLQWLRAELAGDASAEVQSLLEGKEVTVNDGTQSRAVIRIWFEPDMAYVSLGQVWSEEIALEPDLDGATGAILHLLGRLLSASLHEKGYKTTAEFIGVARLSWPDGSITSQSHRSFGLRPKQATPYERVFSPYKT